MRSIEHRLLNLMSRASMDYRLIEPDDRIMACMSGGKDSYVMLHLLQKLQQKVPFHFDIVAVNLDQGQPGFPAQRLADHFEAVGVRYKMLAQDTYKVVLDKVQAGKTYCSLCSRLRRGVLYSAAVDLGCTKVALGHHKDDIIETLMLNLFYSGQLKAMAPRLRSADGRNVLIRPLAYCTEVDVQKLADEVGFPIIPCDLCGSQPNMQRQRIKALLGQLQGANHNVKSNIFAAMGNIKPSHLLDGDVRAAMGLDPQTGEAVAAGPQSGIVPSG